MTKNLDDLLKEFEEKAKNYTSKNKKYYDKSTDELYDVDIHIWRHPGMGNSLQTIEGNKISIMTATSSYLQMLIIKGIITEKELDYMVELIKQTIEIRGE